MRSSIEIAQRPRTREEPLAGEIRLQWWRDALGGAVPEQVAGNPVAAALLGDGQARAGCRNRRYSI